MSEFEQEEEGTTVITLVDDEGEEQDFELLDVLEVDGKKYGLFSPLGDEEDDELDGTAPAGSSNGATPADDEDEDDEDSEGMLILRMSQEDGEEVFEMIEDEEEFNKVVTVLDEMAARDEASFGLSQKND